MSDFSELSEERKLEMTLRFTLFQIQKEMHDLYMQTGTQPNQDVIDMREWIWKRLGVDK